MVRLKNYRADGTLFWNELRLAPVFDEKGKLTHYIGVQTDITQRVMQEQELDQHRHHLEALVEERTKKLEEKHNYSQHEHSTGNDPGKIENSAGIQPIT